MIFKSTSLLRRVWQAWRNHSPIAFCRIGAAYCLNAVLWRSPLAPRLKRRRLRIMEKLLGHRFDQPGLRLLEIGCGFGQDFAAHVAGAAQIEVYGIDTVNRGAHGVPSLRFVLADAEFIPFPDGFFDVVVSVGVLEHIQPIEKLCRVLTECRRVGRAFVHVVPSLATPIEPHTAGLFWQLRRPGRKLPADDLNFFSDDAWLKFDGLDGARLERFFYLPPLISNLIIYRRFATETDHPTISVLKSI
ncbi:MAG: methyltransferase domain-containing protein [Proteobacteria bacterium]|nr:methyltransferase domain-containing protein [Pseudomonadota bacterium]